VSPVDPETGRSPGSLDGLTTGVAELQALYDELWDTGVDPVTLELCRLRMATLIGSVADMTTREPRAVAAGLTEETIEALPAWPTSELFSDAQRCALGFAEQYVIDAHGFTDDDMADMHEHFTDPQLASLTTACAVFDALARVRTVLAAG
jgi:alkylhydroperoxidase family enzyme